MQLGSPGIPPQVLVTWTVEPIRTGATGVLFHVERSQSPDFSDADAIEEITTAIPGVAGQTVYEYLDITVNMQSFWRRWYYRIRAEDTGSSKEFNSDTKTWESSPKVFELEIIARHDFILRRDTGTPCFALVERTAGGDHCQVCYNASLNRSTKSSCTECFGTGRERPFFQPILTFIDFNPPAKITQIQQREDDKGQTTVWWSAFPQLKPRDVLVEVLSGERWRVVSVNPVGEARTSIQHFGTLERISQRDIEHRISIPESTQRQAVNDLEEMKAERRF
jgi:hypothetical protein